MRIIVFFHNILLSCPLDFSRVLGHDLTFVDCILIFLLIEHFQGNDHLFPQNRHLLPLPRKRRKSYSQQY